MRILRFLISDTRANSYFPMGALRRSASRARLRRWHQRAGGITSGTCSGWITTDPETEATPRSPDGTARRVPYGKRGRQSTSDSHDSTRHGELSGQSKVSHLWLSRASVLFLPTANAAFRLIQVSGEQLSRMSGCNSIGMHT